MSFAVPLVLLAVALGLASASHHLGLRKARRAEKKKEEHEQLQRVLIHAINEDRCVGCDACIAVCPTDVLENLGNKAKVVRFADCIQCEQCMWACPTQALVMHPEDEEPPAIQAPNLDPYYQTAVPGMYLVGEVAGKPLVKNAANAGRAVVEHMRKQGLRPGPVRHDCVDVVIVGSGPAGLSAALTCIHHGLSYAILEKEQLVASTVARYPKGKDVMVEPYSSKNRSFLPVFDSKKEELVVAWDQLINAVGVKIRRGEAVEKVLRVGEGAFTVRTTTAVVCAQRVVLATGNRGKPRTLGVPGENLPKVASLLEDPDAHAGQDVLVVGGGDSAVEAALALAEAGARVTLSYRGTKLSRANARNRDRINAYARANRLALLLGSNVKGFGHDDVQIETGKKILARPNQAAFILIGAEAPVAWLEKQGVTFTQRPHWWALGPTDAVVDSLIGKGPASPDEWRRLAAMVLGKPVAMAPTLPAEVLRHLPAPANRPVPPPPPVFARASLAPPPMPAPARLPLPAPRPLPPHLQAQVGAPAPRRISLESLDEPIRNPEHELPHPMSLEDFARTASQRRGAPAASPRRKRVHTAEITRLLRSLRDEGARLADEDAGTEDATLDMQLGPVFAEATPPNGERRVKTPIPIPEAPPRLAATEAVIMGLPGPVRPRARRVVPSFSEEPTKVAAAGELQTLLADSRLDTQDDGLPKIIVDDDATIVDPRWHR